MEFWAKKKKKKRKRVIIRERHFRENRECHFNHGQPVFEDDEKLDSLDFSDESEGERETNLNGDEEQK